MIKGNGTAPLAGFWLGGCEGVDHVNGVGTLARQAGLSAVRESTGWHVAEEDSGRIDLTGVRHIAAWAFTTTA